MNNKQRILVAIFTVVVAVACVALVVFVRSRKQSGQQTINAVDNQSTAQPSEADVIKSISAPVQQDSGTNIQVDQKVIDSISVPQNTTAATGQKETNTTAPVIDQQVLDSISASAK